MNYLEMKKPYWKRMKYQVTDEISQQEFSNFNITMQNINQEGIIISNETDLARPKPYRGLGQYFEIENMQRLNHKLHIKINKNIENMIVIKYTLNKDNNILVNGIEIDMEEDAKAKILIYYESDDDSFGYHNGYLRVNAKDRSQLELINLQNLNGNSKISHKQIF